MAASRFYSSTAAATTLSGSINGSATSITVGATTGFPASTPYTLALDYGAATEELVEVTAVAGTTLTVTRAVDGTSGQSHSLGAVVRHVASGRDFADSRNHEASTGTVHGLTGSIVGTSDTQTLSNKTLTSPTINSGALAGTFTGAPTLSGAVVLSGTPSISTGAALAGTFSGTPTFSGSVTLSGGAALSGTFSGTPTFSGAAVFTGVPEFRGATAATVATAARVTGDANQRFQIRADGTLQWGSGLSGVDVVLFRSAANLLKLSDSFYITEDLTAADGSFVVNSESGELTTYGANIFSDYTPTVGGDGTATYSVQTGYYMKVGLMVFVTIYLSVTNAGSGSDNVTVTTPSDPDRSTRQTLVMSTEGVFDSGMLGTGHAVTFTGGTGAVWDRLRATNNNAANRDGNITGADLLASSLITIQGWYREAA